MTKETRNKWSGTACHAVEVFGDFVRHELHEWLILLSSLTILVVTSVCFYVEAETRDISPLEWLYYPLGAVFTIMPTTVIQAIKVIRKGSSEPTAAPSAPSASDKEGA